MLGEHQAAREAFLAKRYQLQFLNAEHSSFADEVQRAVQQLSALQQNQFGDNLDGPLAPSTILILIRSMMVMSTLTPVSICTVVMVLVILVPGRKISFRRQCLMTKTATSSRRTMTNAEFEQKFATLNESQRGAFACVVEYTGARHQHHMGEWVALSPLQLFITGGAGTGKSHVISVIHDHIERTYTGSGNACMLVAPTGVAAFNIVGLRIHHALNLPVEQDRSTAYKKLIVERLHEL